MRRKRISKKRMARKNATKVVMTPRKNEKPILELGGLEANCVTGKDTIVCVKPPSTKEVELVSLEEISINQELFIV